MGPQQVLAFQIRVDLGVMEMKEYSTFPKAPELEPDHQMRFSVIYRTLVGLVGPSQLHKSTRCIEPPHPDWTGHTLK